MEPQPPQPPFGANDAPSGVGCLILWGAAVVVFIGAAAAALLIHLLG